MVASPAPVRASAPPARLVGISLKLYFGYAETLSWLDRLRRAVTEADVGEGRLFVLPSLPALPDARRLLSGSGIRYGAQNAYAVQRGPYTGEVSPAMVAELGATYLEVGHAERRRLFGEDDTLIAAKLRAASEAGLVPVLCVGEPERTSDPAVAGSVVRRQLAAALEDYPDHEPLVIAYEPVWAIGAERPASAAYVAEVIGAVRAELARPGATRVLYGGSAGVGTFGELVAAADGPRSAPDGLFVGRGGHDIDSLLAIVEEVRAGGWPVPSDHRPGTTSATASTGGRP